MKITLTVDNREPAALKDALSDGDETSSVSFANLEAGDFEFFQNGASVMLIERKEIADLCSSLVDGRFDDQKRKLAATAAANPRPIVLLIEGDYVDEPESVQTTIQNIMLTSRFRDGIFVLRTESIAATAELIRRIADLFDRGKFEPLSEDEQHRRFIASRSAHRVGTQLSRKTDWWQLALAQIDGVGPKAAAAISEKYPTARGLIDAYRGCKSDAYRGQMLAEVMLGSRKLGPKISERVWDTISGGEPTLTARPAPAAARAYTPSGRSAAAPSKPAYTPKPPTTECLFSAADDE